MFSLCGIFLDGSLFVVAISSRSGGSPCEYDLVDDLSAADLPQRISRQQKLAKLAGGAVLTQEHTANKLGTGSLLSATGYLIFCQERFVLRLFR